MESVNGGRQAPRRRFGQILVGLLVSAATLLGVSGGLASAATSSGDLWSSPCRSCTATYTGTYQLTMNASDPEGTQVTETEHFSWSQQVTTIGKDEAQAGPIVIQGAYQQTASSTTDPSATNCSGTISTSFDTDLQFQEDGSDHYFLGATNPAASPDGCFYTFDYEVGGDYNFEGPQCHWDTDTANPFDGTYKQLVATVPAGPYHQTDSCELANTDASNGWNSTQTYTDSLSWSGESASGPGGGSPPPGEVYGPWFTRAKKFAQTDLVRTVRQWGPTCLHFVASGSLAAAGVLVSGLPGLAGVTIAVTGALTNGALAPYCGPQITRAYLDYRTYNDPPLNSFRVLAKPAKVRPAKLAACPRHKAPFCSRLRAAWSRFDVALLHGNAAVAAIEKTVSRERAAVLAGRTTYARAQDADLKQLLAGARRAVSQQTSAARSVARIFASLHLRLRLSTTQDAKQDRKLAAALARKGVTVTELQAVDRSALTPKAVDLISAL